MSQLLFFLALWVVERVAELPWPTPEGTHLCHQILCLLCLLRRQVLCLLLVALVTHLV